VNVNICWFTPDSAHGIAIVAVVEEDAGVFVQSLELLRSACASPIIGFAVADRERLVAAAYDGAEGYRCDDYERSQRSAESFKECDCKVPFDPGAEEASNAGFTAWSQSKTWPPPPPKISCATAAPCENPSKTSLLLGQLWL